MKSDLIALAERVEKPRYIRTKLNGRSYTVYLDRDGVPEMVSCQYPIFGPGNDYGSRTTWYRAGGKLPGPTASKVISAALRALATQEPTP